MERRVRGNPLARCGVGEKLEMTSKTYLSLCKEGAEILTDNCQDTIFGGPGQPHRHERLHLQGEERHQPEFTDD